MMSGSGPALFTTDDAQSCIRRKPVAAAVRGGLIMVRGIGAMRVLQLGVESVGEVTARTLAAAPR